MADMIGDESRRVLRDDHVLAEPPIGELAHRRDDRRVGVRGRDDLEQRQISGRVEKMRAEPVPAEIAAAPSARPAIESPDVFELTIEPAARSASTRSSSDALRVGLLDDRFDNPVGLDAIHSRSESKPPVLIRATTSGEKNGSGFEFSCALESFTRGLR